MKGYVFDCVLQRKPVTKRRYEKDMNIEISQLFTLKESVSSMFRQM
jgi:hypothetical protein